MSDREYCSLLPGGLYDVAANETWLEEQADKGWCAVDAIGLRVCFVKGIPQKMRYRLQPMGKAEESVGQERIEIYKSLGWEYVCSISNVFYLWSSRDPVAVELDTDLVVQADGFRYLKKRMLQSATVEGILMLLILIQGIGGSTVLRNLLLDSLPFQGTLWLVAAVLFVLLELRDIRAMLHLLNMLKAGESVGRPRAYRKRQWMQRTMIFCWVGFILLQAVGLLWPAGNRDMIGWSARNHDRTPENGVVYLDLNCLAERGQNMEFEVVVRKFHELAPAVTQVRMRASEGGVGVSADTIHYVLAHEALSDSLVEEIRYAYRNWEPFTKLDAEGLDSCWISLDDGPQVLVAVRGNEVLEIVYGGATDLRAQGAYLVSLLR